MGLDAEYGGVVTREVAHPLRPAGRRVAIIGAGPAGLFAAERLATAGVAVDVYEQMASPARKLLMAGRGGLNLTHSEPIDRFLSRYSERVEPLAASLHSFPPEALIGWAEGLGQETFIGSSGRVFPKAMKASPLLRSWLRRLDALGVRLHLRHRLTGFDAAGRPVIERLSDGLKGAAKADAVLLACGGASWPRLGSDGAWVALLERLGVAVTPLTAANCGVRIAWSKPLIERFAGAPLKRLVIDIAGERYAGEVVVTRAGLEGGPIYAAGPLLRRLLATSAPGGVPITLDLRPDLEANDLADRLGRPRGKQSTSNWLRKAANLPPLAIALLREATRGGALPSDASDLAALMKHVPLTVTGLAGLERAISTAGGVALDGLDDYFMVCARPGLFVAGEMLDWEAPTGGYLLQGTFATAARAADGILRWLAAEPDGADVPAGDAGVAD